MSKTLTQQFHLLTLKGSGKFQQNLNRGFLFSQPKNGEISDFIGWFYLKDKLLEQKSDTAAFFLTPNSSEKFQENLNSGFQFSLAKNGEIFFEEARMLKFEILLVCFV